MDFEEFCDAVGFSRQNLQMLYNLKAPIGESINRKLIRDFRLYMAIGGMPQAVDAFVSKKSFGEIDKIKQEIIGLYKDDLRKIDKSGRLSEMYESIPAQLTAERNRFTYGYGLKRKYKKDEERLFDLLDSKIVDCCRSVFDISPSLAQYTDYSKFKLYVADTGLFVSMLFNSASKEHEDLYKKSLSDKLELNLGYLYENVAAQIITSAKRKLYYFNFPKENSTHSYEIDFLLNNGNKILPLEIKSSKINVHKSIDEFSRKYPKYMSHSYIISSKDYFKDGNLINLPFYLLPFLLNDL